MDLVSSLEEETVSELRGTPILKKRGGKSFWYDSYRVGSAVKTAYIGADTSEVRARIERVDAVRADAELRRAGRRRAVRILRAEGFLSLDAATGSLIAALAAAGTFRLGGTIVGTHAFRLYEGELGIRLKLDQAASTGDVDIASFERLSVAVGDTTSPTLSEVLSDLSFTPVPSLDPAHAWRWRKSGDDTRVEFLTPSFSDDEGVRELPSLGVHARALHHLNYLISDPIRAAIIYRSGVLVQIPRPERFAIHKLIVADKRLSGPDAGKARKDLMQAEILIEALAEDRPDELAEAYQAALNSGVKWRDRIGASLKRAPRVSAILKNLTTS
ncbi:GSU2403 family nucleotidyltransferase fold protein [Aestuariivirga sp.]|uniref:nucleotidyltransferase family protein n=1 Tax=Aestuariivirga sp. TaxID=2650926 RepID=UPI003BAB6ADF